MIAELIHRDTRESTRAYMVIQNKTELADWNRLLNKTNPELEWVVAVEETPEAPAEGETVQSRGPCGDGSRRRREK